MVASSVTFVGLSSGMVLFDCDVCGASSMSRCSLFEQTQGLEKFQLPLVFLSLSIPCITALVMIFTSSDGILIADFWERLLLFKIQRSLFAVHSVFDAWRHLFSNVGLIVFWLQH